ncbi:MAG: hypothetical protein RIS64_1961 [Bacteroidota bacterium]|jgi:hypothetical protein
MKLKSIFLATFLIGTQACKRQCQQADTTFNNQNFKNVVISPNDRFFVAQDKGLVALKHGGQFWYLDAIR